MDKIHTSTDFAEALGLNWYTGVYLGLPSIFKAVIKKRVADNNVIDAVIVPTHTIKDPVSGCQISLNITDRYFFIGTKKEVESESDIGLRSGLTTITLLRNQDGNTKPSKISLKEIKTVINSHMHRRRETLQEMVNVVITGGVFKEWYGVVLNKPHADNVSVKVSSDEYHYEVDMPIALCKPA